MDGFLTKPVERAHLTEALAGRRFESHPEQIQSVSASSAA
jgi:hypothetical protein